MWDGDRRTWGQFNLLLSARVWLQLLADRGRLCDLLSKAVGRGDSEVVRRLSKVGPAPSSLIVARVTLSADRELRLQSCHVNHTYSFSQQSVIDHKGQVWFQESRNTFRLTSKWQICNVGCEMQEIMGNPCIIILYLMETWYFLIDNYCLYSKGIFALLILTDVQVWCHFRRNHILEIKTFT